MTSEHDDHEHVFTAPLDSFTTHLEYHDQPEHHDNYALSTQPMLQEELLLSGVELEGMGPMHNFDEDEFYDDFDEEEEDDEDEGFDEDDEEDMQAEDEADRANDGSDEGQGHGEGRNLGHPDFLYDHHTEFEWLAHMDLSQHDMTQDLSSSMNVVEDESYFDDEQKKSGIFIPRDAENIEKMRGVLVQEFESETKFKSNELDQIEKRMKDVETIWKRLQKCWSGRIYDGATLYEINNDMGGKKKKKRNKNRTNIGNLYARNHDGTFVKLVCPVCKRMDFATQLGFVNHCRIMHRLKFSSYEDATVHCGVPVEESEVPAEDPSRLSKPLSYFVNKKKTEFEPGSPSSGVVYVGERRAESYFDRDARSSSDTEDGDQKPYIRKVIVGNTAKMLVPELRGADNHTHKWMVYVRGVRESSDLSKFIEKVRFFLHPQFKPDDIVEVRSPPFQITRRGPGLPVRVQIILADGKTKPVHVIHEVKLDFHTPGLQKLGTEKEVVIELDPEFCDKLDQESNSENTFTSEHYSSLTGHKRRLEDDTDDGRRKRQKITDNDVGSFLKIEAEMRFPLVSEEKSGKLPFSCAKNAEQWNSWSLGKRKSSEWQRARRLRIRLEEELNIHHTEWTTKRIATFLRESGLTPQIKSQGNYDEMYQQQLLQYEQMKLRKATKKTLAKKIVFCQFCGCAHFPVDQFDELERRCGERKKILLQSNLSAFADLQARSSAPLPPLTLVPPPRLLAPIAGQPKAGHVVLTTGANQQRQLVYISTSPLSQQQQNALMLKNHVVAVPAKPTQPSTGPRPIASAGQLPNIAPKPPVLVQALNGNVVPSNAIIVASDGAHVVPVNAVPSEDKEKKSEDSHDTKTSTTEPSTVITPAVPVPTTSATPSTPVNITPTVNTTPTPTTVNNNTPPTPTTNTTTTTNNTNAAAPSPTAVRQPQPISISPSVGAVAHVNGMPIHANNIVQVKTQHGTTNAVALPPGAVKVPGVVAVPAHHAVSDKLIHSTPVLNDSEAAWIRTVLAEIGVQVEDESNKLVESVLFKAMMMFTQSLLHECQSVFINERNQDPATEKPFKVMVPNHVLTAILQNKNFDFLTNHGLQRKE